MPKPPPIEIDNQAIEMIVEGMSINQVAKILHLDAQCLSKRLQKRGLTVLKDGKKFVDSFYFSIIDIEEKAYWLGFLMADGNVEYGGCSIELSLKFEDIDHIKKFKTAIKSKHKIGKKFITLNDKQYEAARITFKDEQIKSDLIRYGVVPRKSLIAKFPFEKIEECFYKHFIRGYFDGNGHIAKGIQPNGKTRYSIVFSTGSIDMANDLVEVIHKQTGIYSKFGESRSCYEIKIHNQSHVREFLDYIYKDSIVYLDRKYNKYLDYMQLPSELEIA